MLSVAKTVLEQRLKLLLRTAFLTQFAGNTLKPIAGFDPERLIEMTQLADDFADEAAEPVAEAIYDFVKEIGINITIAPSLISPIVPPLPGGPCTGIIPMSNIKIF